MDTSKENTVDTSKGMKKDTSTSRGRKLDTRKGTSTSTRRRLSTKILQKCHDIQSTNLLFGSKTKHELIFYMTAI